MSEATQDVGQEPGQDASDDRRLFKRRAKKAPLEAEQSAVVLRSLAPKYERDQHASYVTRLTEAVRDPKNRNIALTGRYGSGKSSVLDEFEAQHRDMTVRLAISSLAPITDEPGMTKTNRIQKELVKQIVYSAPKKVGRNSRFSRIAVPSKGRLFLEALLVVVTLGLGLFAFGRLPELKGVNPDWPAWVRPTIWVALGLALSTAATALRVATHGRFRIGDVKAGGTSVSLTEKAPTYFDQFIDELVHYFDQESKDIVIFEDLDRFEDPQIFQELRELNVLLNDTPRRRRKRDGNDANRLLAELLNKVSDGLPDRLRRRWSRKWSARLLGTGEPLRFVYAVKDSLFEQLGADDKDLTTLKDAAAAEAVRANRTKFFDVVIPLVPFISHRNARELLDKALADAGVTDIDRRLVGVAARHGTDMRLLRNICNEYVVFAERLLVGKQVAPDLEPSKLFALVAYKNFHLTDFELITRRASALDRLLQYKQDLVRTHIARLQVRQRELVSHPETARASKPVATRLAKGVRAHSEALLRVRGVNASGLRFEVGAEQFELGGLADDAFWSAVAETGQIGVVAPQAGRGILDRIDRPTIEALFPDGLRASEWVQIDEDARQAELRRNEVAIETLRGAGFRDFVSMSEYALSLMPSSVRTKPAPGTTKPAAVENSTVEANADYTFAALVDAVLASDLARDLVKGGFIDQNFALYAAQFYGHFVGVDVATFVVQCVQPNEMLLDYKFTTAGAVKNLLEEVDDDFLTTVSAYNLDVVAHLIEAEHPGLKDVVARLVANDDDGRRAFLAAYFTSGAQKQTLAAWLAMHPWCDVFIYLATSADVAEDVRPDLVSSALGSADVNFDYELPVEVKTYIEHNYICMAVFVKEQSPEVSANVAAMVARAGVVIPVLSAVRAMRVRRSLVKDGRYKLTADNVRTALTATAETPVGLDEVYKDDAVYNYCLDHPQEYLAAVQDDAETDWSVESSEMLGQVLANLTNAESDGLVDPWENDDLTRLLALAAPGSSLSTLDAAPQFMWPALAAAGLFDTTLANVDSYRAAFAVDRHLGALLTRSGLLMDDEDGELSDAEVEAREKTAVALLNTSENALAPHVRVELVQSIGLPEPLNAELIGAEPNDLFMHLLEGGLVADEPASFAHFKFAGWGSIGPAINVSNGIATFATADLVAGMVGDLLHDSDAADKLAKNILGSVDSYLPESSDAENAQALGDLASLADRRSASVSPSLLVRFARAETVNHNVVLRLLGRAVPPATVADVVNVFSLLGKPYNKITTPGETFTVDAEHADLLLILKTAELVEARRARGKDWYNVKVSRVI